MSKAWEWPRGWQMPGPRAAQNLKNAPPSGLTGVARGGGGCWAQPELTDATD